MFGSLEIYAQLNFLCIYWALYIFFYPLREKGHSEAYGYVKKLKAKK